jgi:hypothetical protein
LKASLLLLQSRVQIRVSYSITADHHDAEYEQAYREQIQLFGDDGEEGGQRELIPDPEGKIWDCIVTFTSSQGQFTFIREKIYQTAV